MSEEIKIILGDSIIVGDDEIPIAHLRYKGGSKRYVTWAITGEEPGLCANDMDLYGICHLDVDIFDEGNYLDIEKEIKKKMKNNEWVWVEDSEEMYEEDTELYHKTISFEKERIL